MQPEFLEDPPQGAALTDYDQSHMTLYLRLLDAEDDGAGWRETAKVLFGLDADREPDRARRVIDRHLARARWMTEHGYRHLLINDHR